MLYYKEHTLVAGAEAGTNYQVPITVHRGTGVDSGADVYIDPAYLKPDFGDLRFRNSDRSAELDYWIERQYIPPVASNGRGWDTQGNNIGPASIYYNGYTYYWYMGGVLGSGINEMDPYISRTNNSTKVIDAPVKVADSPISADGHGAISGMVDNDGYPHLFYGCHATALKHARSNSPEDITAWTVQADIGTQVTYPYVVKAGTTFYLFYRVGIATAGKEIYRTSTDNMATWSAETDLINFLGEQADSSVYFHNAVYDAAQGRIHFTFHYYDQSELKYNNVYYAYFKISDGHCYSVADVDLGTSITLANANTHCKIITIASPYHNFGRVRMAGTTPCVLYINNFLGRAEFVKYTAGNWSAPVVIKDTPWPWYSHDLYVADASNMDAYIVDDGGTLNHYATTDGGASWPLVTVIPFDGNRIVPADPEVPLNWQPGFKLFVGTAPIDDEYTVDHPVYAFDENDDSVAPGSYVDVFLEVTDDLSTVNRTINVLVNDPAATSQSDGDATGLLFDDFDGATLDVAKWTSTGGPNVADSLLTLNGTAGEHIASIATFGSGTAIRCCAYMDQTGADATGEPAIGWNNDILDATAINIYISGNPTYPDYYQYVQGGAGGQNDTLINWRTTANKRMWKIDLMWSGNDYKARMDGGTVFTISGAKPAGPFPIKVYARKTVDRVQMKWVFLRKYTSTEPTHGAWGPLTPLLNVTITSPTSADTGDNTPLLTYTTEGTPVLTEVFVDTVLVSKVSGQSLDTLADGPHTVRVEVTDAEDTVAFDEVSFTVDTTPPAVGYLQITAADIIGTMESGAIVSVVPDGPATAGAVSYPTGTSWACTISDMESGGNGITIFAEDALGNTASIRANVRGTAGGGNRSQVGGKAEVFGG